MILIKPPHEGATAAEESPALGATSGLAAELPLAQTVPAQPAAPASGHAEEAPVALSPWPIQPHTTLHSSPHG